MRKNSEAWIYREVQRPRQFLFIGFIILLAGLFWWACFQQMIFGTPFGDKPMSDAMLVSMWIIVGILMPIAAFTAKLITEVREDGVYVKFVPFHFKYHVFRYERIQDARTVTFRSFRRFGGWGIRTNLKGECLYNISGGQGLELKLTTGDKVIIGSKKAEQLLQAMSR
ncbi:hypothetical protein A374_06426 [Fictibacillus macauensis ZFHKF-1]|uniref:Bacterial Pleckstrin homology domain-containing protein n=1 Tax=Fictibacillus macauensis ZFHKF-1 TaxID=1196324 RepID=I8UHB2_9BACL|nr:DUF6141 family protein [Fictibacillus macauensis]EIT86213.1 hypothetical protein A374_06426 [Fictibacillus macauensis ZFHKF-1]